MNKVLTVVVVIVWGLLLTGCETNFGTNTSVRWFYTGDYDPWQSRASGAKSSHGFASYLSEDEDDGDN